MEYKLKHTRKKKANKVRNREEAGLVRIKIRGRKRWVNITKDAGEKKV